MSSQKEIIRLWVFCSAQTKIMLLWNTLLPEWTTIFLSPNISLNSRRSKRCRNLLRKNWEKLNNEIHGRAIRTVCHQASGRRGLPSCVGSLPQFMKKTRWCKKKDYWRAIEVCKHRAFKLNIKACQKCLQKYMPLQLPFKTDKRTIRRITKWHLKHVYLVWTYWNKS